jgi:hypothetical protein
MTTKFQQTSWSLSRNYKDNNSFEAASHEKELLREKNISLDLEVVTVILTHEIIKK